MAKKRRPKTKATDSGEPSGWKQYLGLVIVVVLIVAGVLVYRIKSAPLVSSVDNGNYQSLVADRHVAPVASGMGLITRIKLTPDNQLMFVASLTGEVWVLARDGQNWKKQELPLYIVAHDMDPAGENGMTGLIVSSDYANNNFIFLTYTQMQPSGQGESQVLRLRIAQQNGQYVGVDPQVIFKGNTPVLGAHQIQGGAGLMIEGKPHLLFAIGEAYHPNYAEDLTREAGKLILIQEDGSNPLGPRPYPQYPRIQAVGIRNVYDVSLDPADPQSVYFTDNGPDVNDTLIQARIFDGRKYNFGWDNTGAGLLNPTVDGVVNRDLVLYHWEVTVAPVDVLATASDLYVNIFSSARYTNKELVTLVGGDQHLGGYQLNVMARRRSGAAGGNLLGLAAGNDGSIYFGDMQDGVVYRLSASK